MYEDDDDATEHEMPYMVTLQEIDKSSSVGSISNPYQQQNEFSRATSHESANLYSTSSQDVGDSMDLDQEAINQYQRMVIPDHQHVPSAPGRSLAIPKSNLAKLSLPSKKQPPVFHHPKDCPDSSAWTDARDSQTSNMDASRTLAISASQAITSELSKIQNGNKEEMELVIRTSVLSLLNASRSPKPSPQDSPCRDLKDSEKGLECQYCYKKKKTKCDLTYVIAKPLSNFRREGSLGYANVGQANTSNAILVHTAAPSPNAPGASAVKMTGNATRTPCTTKLKPGNAPNPTSQTAPVPPRSEANTRELQRPNSAAVCATAANHSWPICTKRTVSAFPKKRIT